MTSRLAKVEEQLAEFHRRAAHREAVIDRLHEENQQLRGGIGRIILEPVVADLIRLYDQLDREVRRLEADGQDGQLMWSFAEDVAQILDRCGIEIFSAEPGDPFEPRPAPPAGGGGLRGRSPGTTRWRRSLRPGSPSATPAGCGARCRRASTSTPQPGDGPGNSLDAAQSQ